MDYFSSLEAEKHPDHTESSSSPCSTIGPNSDNFTQITTLSLLTSDILWENSILRAKNNILEKSLVCSDERNNVLTHELESLKGSPITLANHAADILKKDM